MPRILVPEDVTARDELPSTAGSHHGAPAPDLPRGREAPADSRAGASAEDALGHDQQEFLALYRAG